VIDGAAYGERDVISTLAGLRALPVTPDGNPSSVSRELAVEEPLPRLVMPVGGKITSSRIDAGIVVDRVVERLGKRVAPCTTGLRPFPWSPTEPYRRWARETLAQGLELGLDEESVEACQQRYGTRLEQLLRVVGESPDLARRIDPDSPGCLGEALYAVRHEMALSLEDVVRRRTPLALVSRPSQVALFRVADLIGSQLGWSDERKHAEVKTVFRRPGGGISGIDRGKEEG
jgi:glycerol-3-phosphate dehydrogenase